jgi:hypothetical protein
MPMSWDLIYDFFSTFGYQPTVFVDGIRQYHVVALDVKAGTCTCLALDENGYPIAGKTKTLFGKVRVEINHV